MLRKSANIFRFLIVLDFNFLKEKGFSIYMCSDNDKSRETVADFLHTCEGESSEELEKLAFLCSCSLDCVRHGGSVLIPIGRLGVMLQLLEQMAVLLESSDLKVIPWVFFYCILLSVIVLLDYYYRISVKIKPYSSSYF